MFIKPDFNISSIYNIDLEKLKEIGIKAILFDLDSTIMVSKSGVYSEKTKKWLEDVKKDFKIGVVTNNNKKDYLKKVKEISDFPVYGNAKKPNPEILENAIKGFCVQKEQVAVVGDRPLTDILVGKKAHVKCTILVDSINAENEGAPTRFVRFLERLFIKK